jgi:hypothetical protein
MIRRRWHDGGMNPTDPTFDLLDVRKLPPALLERLPEDPAALQDLVIDLMALLRQEHQQMQQLKQVVELLEGLLPLPPGPSVPRKKKRRPH